MNTGDDKNKKYFEKSNKYNVASYNVNEHKY